MFQKIIMASLLFYCNFHTYAKRFDINFDNTPYGSRIDRVEYQNDVGEENTIFVNLTVTVNLNNNNNEEEYASVRPRRQTELGHGFPIINFYFSPFLNILPNSTGIEITQQLYYTGSEKQAVTVQDVTDYSKTTSPILKLQLPIPQAIQTMPTISTTPENDEIQFSQPVFMQTNATRTLSKIILPPIIHPTSSLMPFSEDCGILPAPPISIQPIGNGETVHENKFPWAAAIMYKFNNTKQSSHQYMCTGSLVSNKHVITAGHCVKYQKNVLLVPVEDIVVIFGEVDIEDWFTNDVTYSNVSSILVHPDYNWTNGDSDVAVFTLSKTVKFTASINPICIWNEDENLDLVVRQLGTVAGWGSDRSENDKVSYAAYLEFPIVSQLECLRSNKQVRTRTFCAGNIDGKGPCNGYGGAGFMMLRNNRWTLRGILSRLLTVNINNMCDLNNYIIFSDIAKLKNWLNEVLI